MTPSDEPPPSGTERRQVSKEEYLNEILSDIDPQKHAGEGWFSTEEYFPQDIQNPYVLGDILGEGEYYPGPQSPPVKWPPARRY